MHVISSPVGFTATQELSEVSAVGCLKFQPIRDANANSSSNIGMEGKRATKILQAVSFIICRSKGHYYNYCRRGKGPRIHLCAVNDLLIYVFFVHALLQGQMICFGIQTYLWYPYLPRSPILSYGILLENSNSRAAATQKHNLFLIRARWPRLIVWHSNRLSAWREP